MLFKYFPNWNFQNDLFKDFLMLNLIFRAKNHDFLKIVEFWPFLGRDFLSAEKKRGNSKKCKQKMNNIRFLTYSLL